MKWNTTGRGLKVLGVSLAVGLGMTACSRDYVVAYVYATSATRTTNGVINGYSVDYQTGALSNLPDSPIPLPNQTGDPVALVASPNSQNLYVVVNNEQSEVDRYAIGTDGKLYAQQSTKVVANAANTIIGTSPTAISIDPAGRFLAVTFTYQNGFGPSNLGPGGFAIFPINADGSLAAAMPNTSIGGATSASPLPYFPVGNKPVGIVVSDTQSNPLNGFINVIDDDASASGVPTGVLLTFSFTAAAGSNTPVISAVANTSKNPGTQPSAIAADPTGRFLYVTDAATNQLYAYSLVGGVPASIQSGPFATGAKPLSVTVDPRGEYVYVANFGTSSVSSFAISASTGGLSGTAGGSAATDTGPTCVTIEPALGIYLYTSNQIGNSVSAGQLSPNTGGLTGVQQSPFTAQALPTCIVAVANGAHASQIVN